jgi:hypothetical protein
LQIESPFVPATLAPASLRWRADAEHEGHRHANNRIDPGGRL